MSIEFLGITIAFSMAEIIFSCLFLLFIIVGFLGTKMMQKGKSENENRKLARQMEEENRIRQAEREDEEDLDKIINSEFID